MPFYSFIYILWRMMQSCIFFGFFIKMLQEVFHNQPKKSCSGFWPWIKRGLFLSYRFGFCERAEGFRGSRVYNNAEIKKTTSSIQRDRRIKKIQLSLSNSLSCCR